MRGKILEKNNENASVLGKFNVRFERRRKNTKYRNLVPAQKLFTLSLYSTPFRYVKSVSLRKVSLDSAFSSATTTKKDRKSDGENPSV